MMCALCECEISVVDTNRNRITANHDNSIICHLFREDCVKELKLKIDKLQIQIGNAMAVYASAEKENMTLHKQLGEIV